MAAASDDSLMSNKAQILIPVTLVVTLVAASWTLRGALASVEHRLESVETKLDELDNRVRDAGADRWRRADMEIWAKRLRELNPQVAVPDIN